jgi:hypothetical protein
MDPNNDQKSIGWYNENPQTHTFLLPEMINSWQDIAESILKRA